MQLKQRKSYSYYLYTSTIVLMCIIVIQACVYPGLSKGYQALTENQRKSIGKAAFLFGDMGAVSLKTLESNGLVYKVTVLSLMLNKEQTGFEALNQQAQEALFTPFGFQYPTRISNWPELGDKLVWQKPAGMVSGTV